MRIVRLADKPQKRIARPQNAGEYPEREAELIRALRPRFNAIMPETDLQPLTLDAFHAGWGLTEIGQALEMLKAEWEAQR
jgi:hypothetical protein